MCVCVYAYIVYMCMKGDDAKNGLLHITPNDEFRRVVAFLRTSSNMVRWTIILFLRLCREGDDLK